MFDKLIIKNVGPIDEVNIEIRPFTIFIGPQGSGKSTIAKLLSICRDPDILPNFLFANPYSPQTTIFEKYNIQSFIKKNSYIEYISSRFIVKYMGDNDFKISISEGMQEHLYNVARHNPHSLVIQVRQDYTTKTEIEDKISLESAWYYWSRKRDEYRKTKKFLPSPIYSSVFNFYVQAVSREVINPQSIYIPSERSMLSALSNSLWSIVGSNMNIPQNISFFGGLFEKARNELKGLSINFLKLKYEYKNNTDYLMFKKNRTALSESASGFQSIIPMYVVVEHLKKYQNLCFIIEEPELNLYPATQKSVVQYLADILNKNDGNIVITTHSPYILSVVNNLIFALKTIRLDSNLYTKISKIIPNNFWMNSENVIAYFVNKNTCLSIMNQDTGLISENELDSVSDTIAVEREKILVFYRKALENNAKSS